MLDSPVQSIEVYLSEWESEARKPFGLPEPSLVLNKTRQGSLPRTIKYLHQRSALHAEHFRRAHLIKLVY